MVSLSIYIVFQKFQKIDDNLNAKQRNNLLNQRYFSLLASSHFSGRIFPVKKIYKLTNDSLSNSELKGYNIVAIITNMGCDCQVRELRNIDSFKRLKKGRKINIAAIYDGPNIVDAVLLKKESNVSFDFYYTRGKEFDLFKKYPAIFLVYDQRIITSLFPLPNDTLLSSYFYRNLSQVLTN